MCGLLAYLSTDADRVDDTRVKEVHEALHCLRHRGPDETQVWSDARVAFGFNRLAFIDIEHSHQPMPYADGRYRIVFNGEIYNYVELRRELAALGARFATEGDTEAIVAGYHYWGQDVVRRLRGMFAFVIWDTRTGTAFGARDPFGINPLFTARLADGALVVSSEKKAVLELLGGSEAAGGVDSASLQHYLTLQYVPEPATLHRGIRRIESGTSFTVVDGELHTSRYFHPSFPVRPVAPDEQQGLYDRIAHALDDSVRVHMRADVTVGAFLSGGIDSTAIAALAKRYNPDLMTFTVGFERQGFSEIDVAAESAAAIGVEHVTKVVTPEEFAGSIPLVVWYLDDPVTRRHDAEAVLSSGLAVEVAVAKTNKYASRESGDTAEVVERPLGGLSVVVVDGQGSGRGAKTLSSLLAGKAAALLKDGVRDGAVARGVSDFLLAYRHGQVSATLDILSFDQAAGTVVLTRNGTTAAAVGRAGRYDIVPAGAGPVGFYPFTRPAVERLPPEDGLRLIVVTDGVAGAGERAGLGGFDVAGFAARAAGPEHGAADLAELVLAEAIRRDGGKPRDDMTVAVLALRSHVETTLVRRLAVRVPLP